MRENPLMMHRGLRIVVVATVALIAATAAAAGGSSAKKVGARCWADVRVLADDSMAGRFAGTPGHRRAAEFVAGEYQKAGLAPGGDDGFFQPVKLQTREIVEAHSSLTLTVAGTAKPLKLGDDAIFSLRGNYAPKVDAPMVFAGYGLKLPQYGVDDLAGLDLKGKVVVAIYSAPKGIPGPAAAHFGSTTERWKVYRDAGAVGVIFIPNPHMMDLPWERIALTRFEPSMVLLESEDRFAGQQLWVQFNPARFQALLEGTPHRAEDLYALVKEQAPLPRFDLPARVSAVMDVTLGTLTSENVVGVLRGSDPALRDEYVVLSAHLDHLGIASEGDGPKDRDRLFNGAMDNASGVAVLMQIARDLGKRKAPKRSVVFAAVTAEEMGLLGSRVFVERARAQRQRIVANLNTDMFLPLYPMRQLMVFGLEESDLGADARAVAQQLNLGVQPDPQPLRNRFIRSDQYSFIREGIPALATKVGFEAGTPDAEIEKKWFAERYHGVSDSPDQPVDLAAIGTYAEVFKRLSVRIANRASAPAWNESSVFAQLAPETLRPSAAQPVAAPSR
jgi:hypothetical protein